MCNICSVCKQKTLKNKDNTIIYTEIKMLQTNSENKTKNRNSNAVTWVTRVIVPCIILKPVTRQKNIIPLILTKF